LITSGENEEALINVEVEPKKEIKPYFDVKVKGKTKKEQELNSNYVKIEGVENRLQPLD
jgi:hypothetical protein